MNAEYYLPDQFNSHEKCLQFLCELKWNKGYHCRKCGKVECTKGKTWYYRKCTSCGWDESCTSNTLFHKLKIPVETAFALIYQLSNLRKGLSCNQIAKLYGISPATAWKFRKRVQQAMTEKALKKFNSHMKKCIKESRTSGRKSLTVEVGCNATSEHVTHIKQIRTDIKIDKYRRWGKERWSGMRGKNYKPRKSKKCLEIDIKFLNEDRSEMTQMLILNLKNWISGTHHFLSMQHFELYLCEFQFRFSRRENTLMEVALELIERMVNPAGHLVKWTNKN